MSRRPPAVNPWAKALPTGLYALCDDGYRPDVPFGRKIRALVDAGAKVVQLRLKVATERDAVRLTRDAAGVCREAKVVCLVNDRVDWALVSGADGVHLGDDDLPVAAARGLLGAKLIGRTVRNLSGIRRAEREGADHVGLGPVFATTTKEVAHAVLGVDALARICRASPLPVVAIGGIGLSNVEAVASAGAHAAAVLSDLLSAPSLAALRARGRGLSAAFERGRDPH